MTELPQEQQNVWHMNLRGNQQLAPVPLTPPGARQGLAAALHQLEKDHLADLELRGKASFRGRY